jgi:hypothetical protein
VGLTQKFGHPPGDEAWIGEKLAAERIELHASLLELGEQGRFAHSTDLDRAKRQLCALT